MPYQPRVAHKYGAYAAQGYEQAGDFMARGTLGAAAATAAGIEARGQSIASGISSAGSSLSSGIQKAGAMWAENKAKMDQATGEIEGMRQAGVITPEEMDAYSKVRNPDKLHGLLAVKREQVQNQMIEQRQQKQRMMDFALDRIEKEENDKNSRKGQPFVFTDPISGQQQTFVDTGSQLVPFKPPDMDISAAGGVKKHDLPGGESYYTDPSGKVVPASSIRKPDAALSMEDPTVTKLRKKKAKLEGRVAEGDVLPGPDWLPEGLPFRSAPYATQLKGVEAELNSLTAENPPGGAVSGQGQVGAPAAGGYKTKEEVKAALQAGTLTKEQAIQILRQQFGM